MKRTIYLLTGLGADEKAFQRIDYIGFDVIHIKWTPHEENDTVESYAKKLLPQITAPSPTLMGLSFGGMLAVEIAKHVQTEKIILVSSAKTRKELPLYFRIAGKMALQRLIPESVLKKPNQLTNYILGIQKPGDSELLQQMMSNSSIDFMRWALCQIPSWKNMQIHDNLVHIHGTKDRLLPYSYISCDYTIDGGGHFMILNMADEVNRVVGKILN